jgi:hypothetical protein
MSKIEELRAAYEAATLADSDVEEMVGVDAEFIWLAYERLPALLEAAQELARFVDYLIVASDDNAYVVEIDRALKTLEKLK